MGIWAGIKYAINSTLGTENFKPLDKLIESMIVDHAGLAGGDSIMGVLISGHYNNTKEQICGTFTPNVDGVVRIHLKCYLPTSGEYRFYLGVEEDGLIKDYHIILEDRIGEASASRDINVSKNKVYTVKAAVNNSNTHITNLSIGTAIADPTLLSYTVAEQ